MPGTCLENVRRAVPLIHCITNYVTVNDVANVLLACGASPVMADEPEEAADITGISSGLTINIGTLNQSSIKAMFLAGKRANALGKPVLLDPVGAGASALRTETSMRLLREIRFTAIRGNMSEIKTLAGGSGATRGVDADAGDALTEKSLEGDIAFCKDFAARTGSVVAVTGAIDLVADARRCYVIRNGRARMSTVTGTGCILSGMICAFLAANKGEPLAAAAAAVAAMGLAGEIAEALLLPCEGNAGLRNRIIDALCLMDEKRLNEGARMEIE